MPQRQKTDIYVYRGNDRNYLFTITDSAGNAIDYSGATLVKLTVKNSLEEEEALFSETATDSSNGNDWANGLVVIKITAANSRLMNSDGVYDLKIVESSGEVTTPVYGDAVLWKNVG